MAGGLHTLRRMNLTLFSGSANLPYQVDALRALMLPRGVALFGVAIDAAVLMGTFAAVVAVAARLYPRMVT